MLEQFAVVPSSDRATLQLAETKPAVTRPHLSAGTVCCVYPCVMAKRTTEYPMQSSCSCSSIVQNHNLIWLPLIPQSQYKYKNTTVILNKADPDGLAV
jgi:hypothetical protein